MCCILVLAGCDVTIDARAATDARSAAASADAAGAGAKPIADAGTGCPPGMVPIGQACMDRYEAPNRPGELPLVMYDFNEADAWCAHRGKRLCFDDEWQAACAGSAQTAYPYGEEHDRGVCNDDKVWRVYSQTLLNGWPVDAASPEIDTLAELYAAAAQTSTTAADAADHVAALYQGSTAGEHPGCVNETGARDLIGNVEEWTRRRDGGAPQFHGNLKGRYWAESRSCQSSVLSHGDGFRFYEIGFRCCVGKEL